MTVDLWACIPQLLLSGFLSLRWKQDHAKHQHTSNSFVLREIKNFFLLSLLVKIVKENVSCKQYQTEVAYTSPLGTKIEMDNTHVMRTIKSEISMVNQHFLEETHLSILHNLYHDISLIQTTAVIFILSVCGVFYHFIIWMYPTVDFLGIR
jgi:hypothetical protein